MTDSWKQYAGDFNSMTDEEIERETQSAQDLIDENTSWVEAVALWKIAGKPRTSDTYQTTVKQYNDQVAHCAVYKRGKLLHVWSFQWLTGAEVSADQVKALGPGDDLPTYAKVNNPGLERPYPEDYPI